MTRVYSLRQRLFVLIIAPLIIMATLVGIWRFVVAHRTAEDLFDRALLAASLAISRDVAISGGDALLPTTSDLIRDATGGELFYHVTGPGGIYITGYAYPPATVSTAVREPYAPRYFEATYRGEPVRVLQFAERMTIDAVSGIAVVTVWQKMSDRTRFARQLALRGVALIIGLLVTLALAILISVDRGLRPLLNLQDAISKRSPDDLSQIKRAVPQEVRGIVATLNRLLAKVEESMSAHQVFISNAAHQLRNPVAAVQSMAEALRNAPTETDRAHRIDELIIAAREASHVTERLLSIERLRQPMPESQKETFDLTLNVKSLCQEIGPGILSRGLEFELTLPDHPVPIRGDRVFISEALKNLIDNALKHGGPSMALIDVSLGCRDGFAQITVRNDGKTLLPKDREIALGRFSQLEPSQGTGLGLAIAASVAQRHGGELTIGDISHGASLTLSLKLAD